MEEGRKLYLIYVEQEGENFKILGDVSVEQYLDLLRTGHFRLSEGQGPRVIRPYFATLVGEIWEKDFSSIRLAERELLRNTERSFRGDGTGDSITIEHNLIRAQRNGYYFLRNTNTTV